MATEAPGVSGAKQQFLDAFEHEHATTMRVLRAYPADRAELRPHPKARSARELAWIFVMEMGLLEKALTTGFDWSKPPSAPPPAPESLGAIITTFDQAYGRVADELRGMAEDALFGTVQFPTGPNQIGAWSKIQFMWYVLCDQIHHRGQFSVYLRMAGGKVPSIYGPSGDEPYF